MKIRNGFVSNSSTSSFCIFGVRLNGKKALEKLVGKIEVVKEPGCEHEFDRNKVKFCPECGEQAWIIEDDGDEDCWEIVETCQEDLKKKHGFDVVYWEGGDSCEEGYYLGMDLDNFEDKRSGLEKIEALREVCNKLKELYPKSKPDFISDSNAGG